MERYCLLWAGWGKHFAEKNKAYRFLLCGWFLANAITEWNGTNAEEGLEGLVQYRCVEALCLGYRYAMTRKACELALWNVKKGLLLLCGAEVGEMNETK